MAENFHIPLRMCVSCRQRDSQSNLLRFQCINGNIDQFKKRGRSFYVCKNCLQEERKLSKALMRQCRSANKDKLMNKLKEIIIDDR